jgi:uncharacterized membrane protein YozB (DUF420 family)
MRLSQFPFLIACLNGLSAFLLLMGYAFIRNKKLLAHKTCMVLAFLSSTLFLIGYLYYHAHVGVVHFTGQGLICPIYFSILTTHTLLAVLVPVLAIWTIIRAIRGEFEKHRKIAHITFPIWVYVSITGVIVYWMLYVLYTPNLNV